MTLSWKIGTRNDSASRCAVGRAQRTKTSRKQNEQEACETRITARPEQASCTFGGGLDIEGDDRGLELMAQLDVVLADLTQRALDNFQAHVLRGQLCTIGRLRTEVVTP